MMGEIHALGCKPINIWSLYNAVPIYTQVRTKIINGQKKYVGLSAFLDISFPDRLKRESNIKIYFIVET